MIEHTIKDMAEDRRQQAKQLNAYDASLWLGRPRGFPLAREMDLDGLRVAMAECYISGGLISHWDGHSISAQAGNEALLSRESILDIADIGVILTGLPLFTVEGGPLTGHSHLPENVRAVRIFPKTHGFPLTNWMLGSLVPWMMDRYQPMFIWHTELDWNELYYFARRLPQLNIVIESQHRKIIYHMRPLLTLMRDCPNVYLEISNLTGPAFDLTLQCIGPERLIFGSFLPVNDPLVPLGMILDAKIPDSDRKLVAGDNLRRLTGGGAL